MTLLQGMCGTTIGLIISSVCKTQQDATQIALGIFYPNMILSGNNRLQAGPYKFIFRYFVAS